MKKKMTKKVKQQSKDWLAVMLLRNKLTFGELYEVIKEMEEEESEVEILRSNIHKLSSRLSEADLWYNNARKECQDILSAIKEMGYEYNRQTQSLIPMNIGNILSNLGINPQLPSTENDL